MLWRGKAGPGCGGCRGAVLALACAVLCAAPELSGANSFDFEAGLRERAKWKSFGVTDWATFNPMELAQPSQVNVRLSDWRMPREGSTIGRLKALIAFAEAGPKGYDAVHTSARIRPPARPTRMTLGQIKKWIRQTPGQPHAIGRYQFIPSTLASLMRRARLPETTRFTPAVQDQLADLLLRDAGIEKFLSGKISLTRFMNNLARIWAGLPLTSGKSAYHGLAGNRATIALTFYRSEMKAIFGE